MANPKYTKIDERFGIIEYPVILDEMVDISKELPKTERKYYQVAFDALKKGMKYKDIKGVDFNINNDLFGISLINTGVIYLELKKMLGTKKRTIHNIPEYNVDGILKAIRNKLK